MILKPHLKTLYSKPDRRITRQGRLTALPIDHRRLKRRLSGNLLLLFLGLLAASCSTLPGKTVPPDAGDRAGMIHEAEPNLGQRLLQIVKIRGQVKPRERSICASATILGVGPEVCLGLQFPGRKADETSTQEEPRHGEEPTNRPAIQK